MARPRARGQMLCLDAILAAGILALMLSALLAAAQSFSVQNKAQVQRAEKLLLGCAISEALVKNHNGQMPILGAAYYSPEKKRAEANVLDLQLLEKASRMEMGNYVVAGLYERRADGKKYFFRGPGRNCIAVERFAAVHGIVPSKAVLGVELCEK